jgi:hypothetical protein
MTAVGQRRAATRPAKSTDFMVPAGNLGMEKLRTKLSKGKDEVMECSNDQKMGLMLWPRRRLLGWKRKRSRNGIREEIKCSPLLSIELLPDTMCFENWKGQTHIREGGP